MVTPAPAGFLFHETTAPLTQPLPPDYIGVIAGAARANRRMTRMSRGGHERVSSAVVSSH
jgi:hypothetical protein